MRMENTRLSPGKYKHRVMSFRLPRAKLLRRSGIMNKTNTTSDGSNRCLREARAHMPGRCLPSWRVVTYLRGSACGDLRPLPNKSEMPVNWSRSFFSRSPLLIGRNASAIDIAKSVWAPWRWQTYPEPEEAMEGVGVGFNGQIKAEQETATNDPPRPSTRCPMAFPVGALRGEGCTTTKSKRGSGSWNQ